MRLKSLIVAVAVLAGGSPAVAADSVPAIDRWSDDPTTIPEPPADGRYLVGDTYYDVDLRATYLGLAEVPVGPDVFTEEGRCYTVLLEVNRYADQIGLIVFATTLPSALILGEALPKTVYQHHADILAPILAWPVGFFRDVLFAPLLWVVRALGVLAFHSRSALIRLSSRASPCRFWSSRFSFSER